MSYLLRFPRAGPRLGLDEATTRAVLRVHLEAINSDREGLLQSCQTLDPDGAISMRERDQFAQPSDQRCCVLELSSRLADTPHLRLDAIYLNGKLIEPERWEPAVSLAVEAEVDVTACEERARQLRQAIRRMSAGRRQRDLVPADEVAARREASRLEGRAAEGARAGAWVEGTPEYRAGIQRVGASIYEGCRADGCLRAWVEAALQIERPSLPARLRRAMEAHRLSWRDVAVELEVSDRAVRQWLAPHDRQHRAMPEHWRGPVERLLREGAA